MADMPTIYLKNACPFCLKLYIFLVEAGIADRFDLVRFDDGDEVHRTTKQRLSDAGQEASFPAAEFSDGTLVSGSDALIDRFAREAGVDRGAMKLLDYYETGVFARHIAMHKELAALKS